MAKNYYSINEAAENLSSALNLKLNSFDVMEMAARGEINLCVPFDGIVAEFRYNYPEPVRANTWRFQLKKAYIKIPSDTIKLRGGMVHIDSIELIEVVRNTDYKAVIPFYGSGCENLSEAKPGCFWGMCTSDPQNSAKIKYTPFEANSDDAVISAQDLLDFLKKNKKPEQLESQDAISTSIDGVRSIATPDNLDPDEALAALFDAVPVEALEKTFPAEDNWKKWVEKAKRNGLSIARDGRAKFNPYKAGIWFIRRGVHGWDEARLYRVLSNILPARSKDKKNLLTGDID